MSDERNLPAKKKPGPAAPAPYRPNRGMVPFTQDRMERFLVELEEHGQVTRACRAVGINRQMAYATRERDEVFMQAWDEARAVYCNALESEADRRGKDGVEEPVGFYQGVPWGTKKVYSDRLLELRLKAERPEKYREHAGPAVSVDAGVLIVGPVAATTEEWIAKHGGRRAVDADHEIIEE
jgi:hypothetical protein